ncbi:MAG TPA: hypothetical protein EYQ24_02970 [Bacteroidetes bacterium]|nr:hypothetical protein [Bacteroidota bacterium]HIL57071.1 hypothetical protein [Rhodothermales bacterium]
MTRSSLFSFGLIALLALSGCSTVEAQRYPTPRRGGSVYQPTDYRNDRYDVRRSTEWRRVQRDIRDYAQYLDRELRLNDRQERRIRDLLEDRTYRLLRNRDARQYRDVYPFPRQFNKRRMNRAEQRFWDDADRRIERILNRQQTREYRAMTDGRSRDRDDRRYRDRDDNRYDDGRRGRNDG